MESRKWKKIALSGLICMLLVFTFWYGGGSASLHGFSVKEETTTEASTASSTEQTKQNQQANNNSTNQSDNNISSEEPNVFQKFFMNVTLRSSAPQEKNKKSSKKKSNSKNLQNNKSVKNNANKATDKAKKKSKKKKSNSKTKKQTDTNNKKNNASDNSNAADKSTADKKNTTDKKNSDNNETKTNREDDSNKAQDSTNGDVAAPEPVQQPEEQEEDSGEDGMITCTIYISCSTLLDHMDELNHAKQKQVPKDGVILNKTTMTVDEGSTVFDVLRMIAKKKNIQLEYSFTPAYKSYYIEGIHNLYEFDGGQLSGWMYSVNDSFPGFGCSAYELKDGDEIKWLYTCDLGKDVGGYFEEE